MRTHEADRRCFFVGKIIAAEMADENYREIQIYRVLASDPKKAEQEKTEVDC